MTKLYEHLEEEDEDASSVTRNEKYSNEFHLPVWARTFFFLSLPRGRSEGFVTR